MSRTRIAITLDDWEKLAQGVTTETTAEAPQLQFTHEKLQGFLEEFKKLSLEQKLHDSRKREVTRRMNEILEEGRRTASALKVGLKQHFGNRNEELIRFGVRPFRRRRPDTAAAAPDGGEPRSSGEPSE